MTIRARTPQRPDGAHRAVRAHRGLLGSERGAISLETTILAPIMIGLVFACVQAGMMYHWRGVANSAAQFGVEAGRVDGATAEDAQAATTTYLSRFDQSNLEGLDVEADRSGDTVTVRVQAQYPQIVPILPLPSIDVHASSPVERVTAP